MMNLAYRHVCPMSLGSTFNVMVQGFVENIYWEAFAGKPSLDEGNVMGVCEQRHVIEGATQIKKRICERSNQRCQSL